jgi:hypothetical protein
MNSSDFNQENTTPSVSAKAKEASKSFKELVETLGKKAKILTIEKTQQLKQKTTATVEKGIRKDDVHDLQALGIDVDRLVTVFEETMNQIETQYLYEEQEKLLNGYTKLLEEQVDVIKTRSDMVKRLKV